MSILLFILKWLGILLLVVLGLLIIAILLVCLVPVRYQLKARVTEGLKAKADVGWLLRLIHIKVAAINLQILCRILALGHCFKKMHIGQWGEEEQKAEDQDSPKDQSGPNSQNKKAGADQNSQESQDKTAGEEPKKADPQKAEPKPESYGKLFEALEKEEDLRREAGETPRDEASEKALQKLKGLLDKVQTFWEDEKNQRAVMLIERQALRLGKHLLPTRFLIEGEIGLADPGSTGRLVGWIYRFYPLYGEHIRIDGVFDRQTVNIYTEIKGRIRLGILVEILLRLLANKRIRQWIRQSRHKDDEDAGKTSETADKADKKEEA